MDRTIGMVFDKTNSNTRGIHCSRYIRTAGIEPSSNGWHAANTLVKSSYVAFCKQLPHCKIIHTAGYYNYDLFVITPILKSVNDAYAQL